MNTHLGLSTVFSRERADAKSLLGKAVLGKKLCFAVSIYLVLPADHIYGDLCIQWWA